MIGKDEAFVEEHRAFGRNVCRVNLEMGKQESN